MAGTEKPFPGLALIVLSRRQGEEDEALGLYPIRKEKVGVWGNDDRVAALAAICGFYNDDHNTQAAEISEYPATPANGAPGNREP
jgi:hypothetical protein